MAIIGFMETLMLDDEFFRKYVYQVLIIKSDQRKCILHLSFEKLHLEKIPGRNLKLHLYFRFRVNKYSFEFY